MYPAGLANTRISTDYAQKSPRPLFEIVLRVKLGHIGPQSYMGLVFFIGALHPEGMSLRRIHEFQAKGEGILKGDVVT